MTGKSNVSELVCQRDVCEATDRHEASRGLFATAELLAIDYNRPVLLKAAPAAPAPT